LKSKVPSRLKLISLVEMSYPCYAQLSVRLIMIVFDLKLLRVVL
jgi:hypothetical protein